MDKASSVGSSGSSRGSGSSRSSRSTGGGSSGVSGSGGKRKQQHRRKKQHKYAHKIHKPHKRQTPLDHLHKIFPDEVFEKIIPTCRNRDTCDSYHLDEFVDNIFSDKTHPSRPMSSVQDLLLLFHQRLKDAKLALKSEYDALTHEASDCSSDDDDAPTNDGKDGKDDKDDKDATEDNADSTVAPATTVSSESSESSESTNNKSKSSSRSGGRSKRGGGDGPDDKAKEEKKKSDDKIKRLMRIYQEMSQLMVKRYQEFIKSSHFSHDAETINYATMLCNGKTEFMPDEKRMLSELDARTTELVQGCRHRRYHRDYHLNPAYRVEKETDLVITLLQHTPSCQRVTYQHTNLSDELRLHDVYNTGKSMPCMCSKCMRKYSGINLSRSSVYCGSDCLALSSYGAYGVSREYVRPPCNECSDRPSDSFDSSSAPITPSDPITPSAPSETSTTSTSSTSSTPSTSALSTAEGKSIQRSCIRCIVTSDEPAKDGKDGKDGRENKDVETITPTDPPKPTSGTKRRDAKDNKESKDSRESKESKKVKTKKVMRKERMILPVQMDGSLDLADTATKIILLKKSDDDKPRDDDKSESDTINSDSDDDDDDAALDVSCMTMDEVRKISDQPIHNFHYLLSVKPTNLVECGEIFHVAMTHGVHLLISLFESKEGDFRHNFWDEDILQHLPLRYGWCFDKSELVSTTSTTSSSSSSVFASERPQLVERRIHLKKVGEPSRVFTHIHFERWKDATSCPDEALLTLLLERIDQLAGNDKFQLGCRHSRGRSATLLTCHAARQQIRQHIHTRIHNNSSSSLHESKSILDDISINIPDMVFRLRMQRLDFLRHQDQLVNVYSITTAYYQMLKTVESTLGQYVDNRRVIAHVISYL